MYLQSWNASIQFISDEKIQFEVPSIKTEQIVERKAEAITDNEFHTQPNLIATEKQLVSVWNGFTIQHEKATKKPEVPSVFIFTPHFEHNSYEIYVPEGKNKVSQEILVSIILLDPLFFSKF